MRVEPFGLGSYVHALKRGARGLPIVADELDRVRFIRMLFYMNDAHPDENWTRLRSAELFAWPKTWQKKRPIVGILAYTLMPNHIHLLLRESTDGGISTFMKKIGQSMTNHSNEKYDQQGSLFQSSYKSRTIETDTYLRYAAAYIMVKNVFELYPRGGLAAAIGNFEKAWEWAIAYPFSSMGEYAGVRSSPVLDVEGRKNIFRSAKEFKSFSRDVVRGGRWLPVEFE
ncbi:transposase [Candidatus Kaiserbacteria bacterium]|nr:transposase [Candidatus Kaiserbacteria bacterium]